MLPRTEAFLKRLYELFPNLVDFDQRTGEIGLFKQTLEALHAALPPELSGEPLVVGALLTEVHDPHTAAAAVVSAYRLRHQ